MEPSTTREPLVDALRALALVGVFAVNALGYAQAPDHPLPVGGPLPADSVPAQVLHGLLVALLQGKAWPFLCFLFGYSLCVVAERARAQGLDVRAVLATRYRRLLAIGIVHGSLVYFGDILTAYAMCGLLAGGWALARPARLLRIWCGLGGLVVAVLAFNGWTLWQAWGLAQPVGAGAPGALAAAHGAAAFLPINIGSYVDALIGTVFSIFPLLLWLTVAGVLARRFRLLSCGRPARRFWAQWFGPVALVGALALNVAFGVASAALHRSGRATDVALGALYLVGIVPGVWLLAAALGGVMRRWHRRVAAVAMAAVGTGAVVGTEVDTGSGTSLAGASALPRWAPWLAPAGRHTLALYLLLSMALVASRGLLPEVTAHTALALPAALVLWLVAVDAARFASRRGLRDPLARWLSRPPRATVAKANAKAENEAETNTQPPSTGEQGPH